MNSPLALQLQQAFLHSQINCKQPVSLLSSKDAPSCMNIPERFGVSASQHEEINGMMRMEENWESSLNEEEGDPPVDPVLSYITEMLMDEEMEDRPCMFMESSAYHTMAEELAGLLGDPSAPNLDEPFPIDPSAYEEDDAIPCLTEESLSSCSADNLFDEILRSPMNKEIAEFLDGDPPALHGQSSTKQQNFFEKAKMEDRLWVYDQPNDGSSDSWVYAQNQGYSSSLPIDHHSFSYEPNGSVKSREKSVTTCSVRREVGLPCSSGDRLGGRSPVNHEAAENGRKPDLFMMLQKSVASHVSKAKTKPFHNKGHMQEKGSSLQEINSRSLERTKSGRYVQMDRAGMDGERLREPETHPLSWMNASAGRQIGGLHSWRADLEREKEEAGGLVEMVESGAAKEDLIELLKQCAHYITRDDMRKANQVMREIRQEATPFGDGRQRLAFYFAEALVARMSGAGACLYAALDNNCPSAAEMLKAYHLRIENCPFIRICHFFSNQTIINACEGESRLHVVDYGILYGFQWPSLIQALASRPHGPPHLRITGIDLPQPGFKPAERVEATGRRLADYARAHGVAFEYQAMAVSRWEDIQPASLFLRHDEVLAVNCMFRLRHLLDETVMADSPRKKLLCRIRSSNPKVFVEAVVNAGYNAPFGFMPRFQEALAHFDSIYDAIDSCVARDNPDRRLLEREIFGREILNVVACEGLERVERAEQYKHWQSRTQRAGFQMIPLDRSICNRAKLLMQQYHPDYSLSTDDDDGWLKIAWRGRYSRCVSAWSCKPS